MSVAEKASIWLNQVGKTKYKALYDQVVAKLNENEKLLEIEIVFQMLNEDPSLIQQIFTYVPTSVPPQSIPEPDPKPISPEKIETEASSVIDDSVVTSTSPSVTSDVSITSDEPKPVEIIAEKEKQDVIEESEGEEESTSVVPYTSDQPPTLPPREESNVVIGSDGEIDISSQTQDIDEIPPAPDRPMTPKKAVTFKRPLTVEKIIDDKPIQLAPVIVREEETESIKQVSNVKETTCKESVIVDPKQGTIVTSAPECTVTTMTLDNPVFSTKISESVVRNSSGTVTQTKITKIIEPIQETTAFLEQPKQTVRLQQSEIVQPQVKVQEIQVDSNEPLPQIQPTVSTPSNVPVEPKTPEIPIREQQSLTQPPELPPRNPPISIIVENPNLIEEPTKQEEVPKAPELPPRNPPISIVLTDIGSNDEMKKIDQELVEEQKSFKEQNKKQETGELQTNGPSIIWIRNEEGNNSCLVNYLFVIIQSELKKILLSRAWESKVKDLLSKNPNETFGCSSFDRETFGTDSPTNFVEILSKFFVKYPISQEQKLTIIYPRIKLGRRNVESRDPWMIVTGAKSNGSLQVESSLFPGEEIETIAIPYFCFFVVDRSKHGNFNAFPPERLNNGYSSELERPIHLAALLTKDETSNKYSLFLNLNRKYYEYSYPSTEPLGSYSYEDLLDLNLGSKVVLFLYRSV